MSPEADRRIAIVSAWGLFALWAVAVFLLFFHVGCQPLAGAY